MTRTLDADSFSRTAKMFADAREVATLEEAEERLATFILQMHVGQGLAHNLSRQAAVLTVVNSAARAFKGGVRVQIGDDVRLEVGWRHGEMLSSAVAHYGGVLVDALDANHPTICVGEPEGTVAGRPVVRATFDGWTAGVVEGTATPLGERDTFAPAGIAAAGIAVAEIFENHRGAPTTMGRRSQGMSLWRPGVPWMSSAAIGPDDVTYAPSKWWIVGLGHLGQGYLWSIGMLSYSTPSDVFLMLQDDDLITTANESTGLLLVPGLITNKEKKRKTRVLAALLEARGFTTTVTERRLQPGHGPTGDEPRIALVGVDNTPTRAQLSDCGFDLVVDAGLGGGPSHYLDMQFHSFPGPRRSDAISVWQQHISPDETLLELPAYRDRVVAEGDECGTVEIANRSVAASFVGATAGATAIAEAVRALRGQHRYEVIDGSLRGLESLQAVMIDGPDPIPNTGYSALG
jgi:hypothetical protein